MVGGRTNSPGATFSLEIPGKPVPKGRPRVDRSTGRFYTPRATQAYEKKVAWYAVASGVKFAGEPISVSARFYVAPGRVSDLDNLLKALLDGLQRGGLFDDDSQIVELYARSEVDESYQRVVVEVERA